LAKLSTDRKGKCRTPRGGSQASSKTKNDALVLYAQTETETNKPA